MKLTLLHVWCNVDTTGVSSGNFLKYDGSTWVDATIAVSEMTDVDTADVGNGDILKYDGSTWVDASLQASELTDIDTTGAQTGNFLKYNGSNWVDSTIAVSEMTDINTSGVADGNLLKYDLATTTWLPATIEISELSNVDDSNAVLGNVLTYNNGDWVVGNPVLGTARATSMFVGAAGATPTDNADILLHVNGDAAIDGAIYISGGSDLAEGFHIMADEAVEPGTVVSIDPNNIGKLIVSDEANDTKVAGVVSGANGIKAGLVMTQTGTLADGEYPIALTGRVWVKCSNENGDITVGDLLTTATKKGHAMRTGDSVVSGSVLGKAMSPCTSGGVLTLISLQ